MTGAWPAGLLLAYPPEWRDRYGEELEVLVRDLREHGRHPVPMTFDLLRGAAAAWCRDQERIRHVRALTPGADSLCCGPGSPSRRRLPGSATT